MKVITAVINMILPSGAIAIAIAYYLFKKKNA